MYRRFKITFILFIVLSLRLQAQEKWTLDECVAFALENNLQLNDFQYTAQSGRETYRQSIRNLLPNINGSSNYVINFGRNADPFTNDVVTTDFFSNNYSLESSIDLFQGFQKINAIKASNFLYKATQEETLQEKYLLAFRVMQAFYDIRFAEGLVAISKEQLRVSQANYDLVEKQIELGLKAGADLYEAESLLLTDRLNLTQSKNQLAAAKLALIQEMNLEGTADIAIQSEMLENSEVVEAGAVQSDSIYKETKEFLPLLKAQELRVRAAKKQLDVERGKLFPSLSLFAGVGTGYFETTRDTLGNTIAFRDQFKNNTFQFIGVSLNVPISNGWSAQSRIKQQKIERLRAKNNLDIQEQLVFQTIQQLVQDYESLVVEHEQSDQNVASQRLAFEIAQKRYEKGLINALELFQAKNLFASAQNENLQVRLRSEINKSTLDFYRGLPVFDIN
ncbi:MAG: TolC family protein [Pricia sp.]